MKCRLGTSKSRLLPFRPRSPRIRAWRMDAPQGLRRDNHSAGCRCSRTHVREPRQNFDRRAFAVRYRPRRVRAWVLLMQEECSSLATCRQNMTVYASRRLIGELRIVCGEQTRSVCSRRCPRRRIRYHPRPWRRSRSSPILDELHQSSRLASPSSRLRSRKHAPHCRGLVGNIRFGSLVLACCLQSSHKPAES